MEKQDWLATLLADIVEAVGPQHRPEFKVALTRVVEASYKEMGLVTPDHITAQLVRPTAEIIPFKRPDRDPAADGTLRRLSTV